MRITPGKVLFITFIAAAAYELSRLKSLKDSVFRVVKIRIPNAKTAYVTVEISNENPFDVTVNSFSFNILFNSENFGLMSVSDKFILPANGKNTIEIPVKIDPVKGIKILTDIILKKKTSGEFTFDGSITADGIKIPVKTIYKAW